MRARITLFLLLIVAFSGGVVQAQEAKTWYWAVTDIGALVAYTADGQVNTLADSGVAKDDYQVWRVRDDTLIAKLKLNSSFNLYDLTPNGFYPIQVENAENFKTTLYPWQLVKMSPPYVLLAASGGIATYQVMVVNTETNSANLLTGELSAFGISFLQDMVAFSQDGKYLIYASSDEENTNALNLIQHKLETGEERTIYQGSEYFLLTGSSNGDYWLSANHNGDTDIWTYTMISKTGSAEIIAEEPNDEVKYREIKDDFLITYPQISCQSNCEMDIQTLPNGTSERFLLDGFDMPSLGLIVYPVGDKGALIDSQSQFLTIDRDGSRESIGFYSRLIDRKFLSADHQWLVVVDNYARPTRYRIWNIPNQQFVLENDYDFSQTKSPNIVFGTNGFIIQKDDHSAQIYRYMDGKAFDFPPSDGTFVDVLGNGNLLYSQSTTNEIGDAGIYRYDPEVATYTLLIAKGMPIVKRDA